MDNGIKSKLQAIINIINEMDDMELNDMAKSEEEPTDDKGLTMISIKAKPSSEDMMEEEEPMENEEEMPEEEMPEEEEKIDPSSALGRLKKRLQGSM